MASAAGPPAPGQVDPVVSARYAGSPGERLGEMAGTLGDVLSATVGPRWARERFWTRVSGHPAGAPGWVRDIARVGIGPGWFEPGGVVWQVHADLATLAGGVAALLGQATHPLALAGVQQ